MPNTKLDLAEFRQAVAESHSIAGVLRFLCMRVGGGNYRTVNKAIRRLQLDTSHWTGQGHRRGTSVPVVPPMALAAVLVQGSTYNSNRLRKRLLREGILEPICSSCRLRQWMGVLIPLELDHLDGNRVNNELSNLRLLCPNCHALTPTYRGRNVAKRRSYPPGGIKTHGEAG